MRPLPIGVYRRAITYALAAVVLCLGFISAVLPTMAHAAEEPITRTQLYSGSSFYPRLIRLEHNGDANGTIMASVNTAQQTGVILASTDGGKTFQERATIADSTEAPNGSSEEGQGQLCCSTLLELPVQVGDMPAGTLLWADTIYKDRINIARHVEQRMWASTDQGNTWRMASVIQSADTIFNVAPWGPRLPAAWEPNLSVSSDGQLVAVYSDETDGLHHSQKLVQVRSKDGVNWTDKADTVVSDDPTVRPGMGVTIKLPNGTYFMTYEICSTTKVYPCNAYYRTSPDGWNFDDPRNLGVVIRTADGGYVQHTPYPVWSPGPGPNGSILLTGQMMADSNGRQAPDTGRVLVANDNLGSGPWYKIPTPIVVDGVTDAPCKNYSSPLLPSEDGKTVMEAATDIDNGVCRSYVASGSLAEPSAPDAPPPPPGTAGSS